MKIVSVNDKMMSVQALITIYAIDELLFQTPYNIEQGTVLYPDDLIMGLSQTQ